MRRWRHDGDALNAAGYLRIFDGIASGALDGRPQLAELLDHLRAGDTLVLFPSSTPDLIIVATLIPDAR